MGIKTTQYYRHEACNRIGKAGHLISALLMDAGSSEIELDLARVHLTDALVALQGRPGLSPEARLELLAATSKSLTASKDALDHQIYDQSEDADLPQSERELLSVAAEAIKAASSAVDCAKFLTQKS